MLCIKKITNTSCIWHRKRRTIFKQDQLAGVVLEVGGAGEDDVELVSMGFFQEIFCADGGVSGKPIFRG